MMPCAGRLMTLECAAEYCGVPVRNFRKHIGIPPVRLGPNELWDRVALDAHIEALQGRSSVPVRDWRDDVQKF